MIEAIILVGFPMLVAFGGATDLLTMKIQNRVSILLIASFVIVAVATSVTLSTWGGHLLAFIIVFGVCFGFFAAGWMGGGDVKFVSAISLWIGFTPLLIEFLLGVGIYGAILTVAIFCMRKIHFVPGPLGRQEWFCRLHDPKNGIPYGIAIAISAIQIYPKTPMFSLIGQL